MAELEKAPRFRAFFVLCATNEELKSEFDRLRDTNVSRHGGAFDLAIDDASGRFDGDVNEFILFVIDLWERLPPEPS